MADFRMREVRALLNTTMESILRRAMFEIMKIVENSLHDHQLELAQKGEEIVQLKVKLQRVEMKLRDTLYTDDPAAQLDEMQKEAEDVGTQNLVAETDFEVPEDWCAPVGYETPTNPDDGLCPSVRLRPLSIPLYPIPVVKQEVAHQSIDPHQGAEIPRRSKTGSLPVQEGSQTLDNSLTDIDQKLQRKKVRGDIAILLQENAEQHANTGLRSRGTTPTEYQQDEIPSAGEVGEGAAANSEPAEQQTEENDGAVIHPCRFCKAPFDTEFGRDVHERFHKWCRGCKNIFPSPGSLLSHKSQCKKLKNLMAKRARSKAASEPLLLDAETQSTPSLEEVNIKEDSPESAHHIESVLQNYGIFKKYSCIVCNKKFLSGIRQAEHMRIHTGEKPFHCCLCPKNFRIKELLKRHMMRVHKDACGPTKGDLAWAEPLEVTEESVPSGEDMSASVNQMVLFKKQPLSFRGQSLRWKACGTKVPGGFCCNVCSKVKKTKFLLVEHHRVHTREKPFKCPCCHSRFRFQGQFSTHYKKCNPMLCDKDMSNISVDSPLSCKVDGKVSQLQDT